MPRTATAPRLTLDDAEHALGCPKDPERSDWWTAPRPLRQGGGHLLVVKCLQCGRMSYRNPKTNRRVAEIDPFQAGKPRGVMEVGPEASSEPAHDDEMEA